MPDFPRPPRPIPSAHPGRFRGPRSLLAGRVQRRLSLVPARSVAFAVGLLLVGTLACESTTEPPLDVPEGVALTLNGTVVARAVGGVIEGGVHVHVGEYSGVFVVSVLNGRGEPMPLDADHYLEATVGDLALATFVQPTPGAFQGEFEMYGEEGESTIVFRLMRTGSTVAEWTSPAIELVVTAC